MASSFNLFPWLPALWATFFDRMQKVIWITGCRGFIGRHLAAWLSRQGHTVVGIGHGPWPTAEARAWGVRRWLDGGIHASNLQQLLRDAGPPEFIFHLAGGSAAVGASIDNPYEDFTRTVATTAELLEWMRLAARTTRLVSVSSAAVYGAGHTGPIREEQALLPFSPYGYHKLMMENVCRSYAANYGLAVAVGPVVFGVRQLAQEAGVVGYVFPGWLRARGNWCWGARVRSFAIRPTSGMWCAL